MADCRVIKVIADSGAYEPNRSAGGREKRGMLRTQETYCMVADMMKVSKVDRIGVEGFDKRVLPYNILGLT